MISVIITPDNRSLFDLNDVVYEVNTNKILIEKEIETIIKLTEHQTIHTVVFDIDYLKDEDDKRLFLEGINRIITTVDINLIIICNVAYEDKFINKLINVGVYSYLNLLYDDADKIDYLLKNRQSKKDVARYDTSYINQEVKVVTKERIVENTKIQYKTINNKRICVIGDAYAGKTFMSMNLAGMLSAYVSVTLLENPIINEKYYQTYFNDKESFYRQKGDSIEIDNVFNEKYENIDIVYSDFVTPIKLSDDIIRSINKNNYMVIDSNMELVKHIKGLFDILIVVITDDFCNYNRNLKLITEALQETNNTNVNLYIVVNKYEKRFNINSMQKKLKDDLGNLYNNIVDIVPVKYFNPKDITNAYNDMDVPYLYSNISGELDKVFSDFLKEELSDAVYNKNKTNFLNKIFKRR